MNGWIVFGILAAVFVADCALGVWVGMTLARLNPTDDYGNPI